MSKVNKNYTEAELKNMSDAELTALGAEMDGVTVAFRKERFPVAGDPAEKRAAVNVGVWAALAIVMGLAFLAIYLFWQIGRASC